MCSQTFSDDRSEEKAPSDHTPFTALGITESEYAAYIEYCQILRSLHILDFDDLLTETLNLMKSDPTIPAQCFSYLHVDEFQDISPIQYRLIMEWTKQAESFLSSVTRISLFTASAARMPNVLNI